MGRAICEEGRRRGLAAEVEFVFPRTAHGYEEQIRRAGFAARPVEFALTEGEVAAILRARRRIRGLDHRHLDRGQVGQRDVLEAAWTLARRSAGWRAARHPAFRADERAVRGARAGA